MKNTFLLILVAAFGMSCSNETEQQQVTTEVEVVTADETGFVHVVYFWLNEDISDEDRAKFETVGLKNLATCPTIQKVYFGPPAMSPRDVVDNSYDFAWVCHFKNKADQDAYQVEPIHLKFIEDFSSMWTRVQIYDNLVTN
jgi:hypothetical protein